MRPGTRISYSLQRPHSGPSRAERGRRDWQPATALRDIKGRALGWLADRDRCRVRSGTGPIRATDVAVQLIRPPRTPLQWHRDGDVEGDVVNEMLERVVCGSVPDDED